tara:strand:- start:70 stop:657 length:588 start_codon:yes stop_codon:yes gene_type:complete
MAITINGSTNTISGLAVGGLPDGVVDTDMIASSVSRITEVDQWYLTTDHNTNQANLTAWSRYLESGRSAASPHGTGMSHASGTFTFPSTGKYLIYLVANYSILNNDNVQVQIRVTEDNSTYVAYSTALDGQVTSSGSQSRSGSGTAFAFVDVTNTAQVKVQFFAESIASGTNIKSSVNQNGMAMTTALFIRIGDT